MRLVAAASVLLAVAGCSASPGTPESSEGQVGADCGAGPLPPESAAETPDSAAARERVEAFIEDYYRAWERAGHLGSTFDAWNAELARLASTHMVDDDAFPLGEGALASPASHDPEHEKVFSVSVAGDGALVRSRMSHNAGIFYSYRLTRVGVQWRIERTVMTFDPPTAPVMDAQAHAAMLDRVPEGTALQGHPTRTRRDLEDLFAPPFTVEELPPITTSGVMAVHDFGWVAYDLAPLAQRVPPGTYPVVVSHRADGTNVALRVTFADEQATKWVDAERVGSNNVVSVDAGNVVVLDFATMPTCRNDWMDELYQDHVMATDGDVFSIAGGPDDAVMVQAGYGDGGYPVYWGVADDGTITDLVVDFLVG
jgi:hypothetical protein